VRRAIEIAGQLSWLRPERTKSRANHPAVLSRDQTAQPLPERGWSVQVRMNSPTQEDALKNEQIAELLYQALETERGGIAVYTAALACAVNADLKKEWEEYLEQTRNHERIVLEVMGTLGLDPDLETPGQLVVRQIGESLVEAMEMALEDGPPEAAQLVACESVVQAETKDHLNWELIHEIAEKSKGELKQALMAAYDQVEDEEDEHLYHSTGWCRELWIESLGMPAVLPPPEEEKEVKTAIGAARARKARKDLL
jgi:rubrerythrin